jgi:hypothetical protein
MRSWCEDFERETTWNFGLVLGLAGLASKLLRDPLQLLKVFPFGNLPNLQVLLSLINLDRPTWQERVYRNGIRPPQISSLTCEAPNDSAVLFDDGIREKVGFDLETVCSTRNNNSGSLDDSRLQVQRKDEVPGSPGEVLSTTLRC